MKKLSKKQGLAKDAFLKYPTKSDNQIAKLTGISQPMISKYRKMYNISIDKEFIAIVAGKFISEFGHAVDHWKMLIQELEDIKNTKRIIVSQNDDTGQDETQEFELSAMEKLSLIREQANLRSRILFLASQGEVREVIKVMRTGQLPAVS